MIEPRDPTSVGVTEPLQRLRGRRAGSARLAAVAVLVVLGATVAVALGGRTPPPPVDVPAPVAIASDRPPPSPPATPVEPPADPGRVPEREPGFWAVLGVGGSAPSGIELVDHYGTWQGVASYEPTLYPQKPSLRIMGRTAAGDVITLAEVPLGMRVPHRSRLPVEIEDGLKHIDAADIRDARSGIAGHPERWAYRVALERAESGGLVLSIRVDVGPAW